MSILSTLRPFQLINVASFGVNTLVTYGIGSSEQRAKEFGFASNKEISDENLSLVTPAGWTFSIWGPIFLLEGGLCVYQFFASDLELVAIESLSPYLVGVNLLQSAWTLAFGKRKLAISTVLLAGISGCLSQLYFKTCYLPIVNSWYGVTTHLPFAMHFTWGTFATLLNVNLALKQNKADPLIRTSASYLSALIGCAISLGLAVKTRDPIPAFVSSWALLGINNKPKETAALDANEATINGFNNVTSLLSASSFIVGLYFSMKKFM